LKQLAKFQGFRNQQLKPDVWELTLNWNDNRFAGQQHQVWVEIKDGRVVRHRLVTRNEEVELISPHYADIIMGSEMNLDLQSTQTVTVRFVSPQTGTLAEFVLSPQNDRITQSVTVPHHHGLAYLEIKTITNLIRIPLILSF